MTPGLIQAAIQVVGIGVGPIQVVGIPVVLILEAGIPVVLTPAAGIGAAVLILEAGIGAVVPIPVAGIRAAQTADHGKEGKMGGCLFALALVCFLIGFVQLFLPEKGQSLPRAGFMPDMGRAAAQNSVQAQSTPAQTAVPQMEKTKMQSQGILAKVQVGDRIRVKHPQMGELTVYVLGKVRFSELWQTSRGPQSPWVPTGNAFEGLWLETNVLLLNWQTRYYLLDESTPVSDVDIQRDFAAHAKKFAQSDQTADVYFAYPPAMWHIDDIGKFMVQETQGEGIRSQVRATGRFIHASGDGSRALVLEDYEGGGGPDTVWTGYLIESADIQKT